MCCRLQVYRKGKIGGNWGTGRGGEARDEEKVGRLGKGEGNKGDSGKIGRLEQRASMEVRK